MDLNLTNKKALVTGGSQGLGYGCALMLACEGADVTISARDPARLADAQRAIQDQSGRTIKTIPADLTDEQDLAALSATGPYDIVVVSTGHPPTYSFSKATDAHWAQGYSLIINPVIALSRAFLPAMQEQKFGRFIFIGSIFGLEPEKSSVVQSTFRTGLNALSKCIATEYAPYGITANVICPGYFETPLVGRLAHQYADQDQTTHAAVMQDWAQYSPTGEMGNPDDLGALVCFLASLRGRFINGTSLTMDGGSIRQY